MDEDLIIAEVLGLIRRGPALGGAGEPSFANVEQASILYYVETDRGLAAVGVPEGLDWNEGVQTQRAELRRLIVLHWQTEKSLYDLLLLHFHEHKTTNLLSN